VIRGEVRLEQIGAFWNASRCQPQVVRESLQAGPASADAIGDTSKACRKSIMQHAATNEAQNVILWSVSCELRLNRLFAIASSASGNPWRGKSQANQADRRMKIGFVRLLDSALVRPKLQSAND
jgi:hypothetical protein